MTPSGIKPATFRFVAQHLNHCATAVPPFRTTSEKSQYLIQYNEIEAATFRFVAQHPNLCATAVPPFRTTSERSQYLIQYNEIEAASFRFVAQHPNLCATDSISSTHRISKCTGSQGKYTIGCCVINKSASY